MCADGVFYTPYFEARLCLAPQYEVIVKRNKILTLRDGEAIVSKGEGRYPNPGSLAPDPKAIEIGPGTGFCLFNLGKSVIVPA